jgi:hypothetical protein
METSNIYCTASIDEIPNISPDNVEAPSEIQFEKET